MNQGTATGRISPFLGEGGKVWNRRISLVAGRPGEGPLTEPIVATQPRRQEPLFMHPIAVIEDLSGVLCVGQGQALSGPPSITRSGGWEAASGHVVGHHRVGETSQSQRANLLGWDASFQTGKPPLWHKKKKAGQAPPLPRQGYACFNRLRGREVDSLLTLTTETYLAAGSAETRARSR